MLPNQSLIDFINSIQIFNFSSTEQNNLVDKFEKELNQGGVELNQSNIKTELINYLLDKNKAFWIPIKYRPSEVLIALNRIDPLVNFKF